jgi:predicted RecB family nuclease
MTFPPVSTSIAPALSAGVAGQRLSKSRFVAGKQCHKLLWWKVHEPLAVELQPDKVLQDRFDQGAQVGALARERFAGGTLIDLPHHAVAERVEATRRAIDAGAAAIFEASFVADNTFVAVDVLLREGTGWRLIEVKSASSQKEEHLLDIAVQAHVLALSGIDVVAMEVMHLSKDFRNPDQGDLFEHADVTAEVRLLLSGVHTEIEAQLAMLGGALPEVPVGLHCHEPRDCPFMERCWPPEPDHIRRLYYVGPKRCHDYMVTGVHRIGNIPAKQKLPEAAKRQIRAMKENCLIVEPGLRDALKPFDVKLGFLDFETIQRAVPVWPGMAPWEQAAAQFSYHESAGGGGGTMYSHAEFLAEGSEDARPLLAERMIEATSGAERVVTYSAFEKTRIRGLQLSVPSLKRELLELEGKLIDLLPVLRDHVYHPDFQGSFSLKFVLTPLVPELTYSDLVIVDGMVASVEIARLLFVAQKIPIEERARVRQDLLNYCERDTWAMVKLLERMRELAGGWRPRPDLRLI